MSKTDLVPDYLGQGINPITGFRDQDSNATRVGRKFWDDPSLEKDFE